MSTQKLSISSLSSTSSATEDIPHNDLLGAATGTVPSSDHPGPMESIADDWTDEQLLDLLRHWVGHWVRKKPEAVTDEEVREWGSRLAYGLPPEQWPGELSGYEDESGNLDEVIADQIQHVIDGLGA